MRQIKRLFYLILLNVLVAAATTWAVLSYWQRSHPVNPNSTPLAGAPLSLPALPTTPQEAFEITQEADKTLFPLTEDTSLPPAPTPTFKVELYQVQPGDTLGTIARRFNVTVEDILRLNDLPDPDIIPSGITLYIPLEPLPPRIIPTATPAPASLTPTPTPQPTLGASPTPTASPPGEPAGMTISAVFGAGDLATERVVLTRTGDGELSLAGWRLQDSQGNFYIFPQLDLFRGGTVSLHTRAGLNTVVDLYWGLTQPVWESGELAILRDAQGVERATFQVP